MLAAAAVAAVFCFPLPDVLLRVSIAAAGAAAFAAAFPAILVA